MAEAAPHALADEQPSDHPDGLLRPRPGIPGGLQADLPTPCVQNHAANLTPLRDGSLGCVWFGGTQEGVADISVYFSRLVPGASGWTAPVKLSDDDTRSEQNPILFEAPDSHLWLMHTAQVSGNQDTAIVRCRQSADGGRTWSDPRALFDRAGSFVRQPPVVVPTGPHRGDWLLPVFHCRTQPGQRWTGEHDDSAVMVSSDQGATWAEHPVPGSLGCVHMNLVPAGGLGEGWLAFYRSRWADHVYANRGDAAGRVWTPPQPTVLPNNNSSIQVLRLTSGRLAMVYNASSAASATERRASLYDDLDDAPAATESPAGRAFWGAPRAPLTLALSDDDGATWPWQRDLATGDGWCLNNDSKGRSNRELSYPSITQTPDGALHVAFTVFRRHIRHLRLDEGWVMGG